MLPKDRCAVLRQWKARGELIVLMMDTNENVVDGVLSRMLAADNIKLKEAVHSVTSGQGPKTHFKGKELIDRILFKLSTYPLLMPHCSTAWKILLMFMLVFLGLVVPFFFILAFIWINALYKWHLLSHNLTGGLNR